MRAYKVRYRGVWTIIEYIPGLDSWGTAEVGDHPVPGYMMFYAKTFVGSCTKFRDFVDYGTI